MASLLMELFANKVFLAILLGGVLSQGLKILLIIFKHKLSFHPKDLVVTGGMPSSHSALVTSLVVILYLEEGFTSLFFLSLVLALIVLRDAYGVRRTAGEEGHIINTIIEKTKLKIKELHYSLGHTPKQVMVGIIIGFFSGILASLL